MSTRYRLTIVTALLMASPLTEAAGPRAILIEARDLAYDANYRNDQAGLRSAIGTLQGLVQAKTSTTSEEAAYANYYLSWAYWALVASQVQENNMSGAVDSAKLALEHARLAFAARDTDPEFHTALANALVAVGFLQQPPFHKILDELMAVRRKALELGPENPRVVLMDAGVIFNSPPEVGGGRELGLVRWQDALRLFEAEANLKTVDPIAPRWGHALAYGWITNVYMRMTPPQKENARSAAETALRMRPDFWWVREQVLPQLRE